MTPSARNASIGSGREALLRWQRRGKKAHAPQPSCEPDALDIKRLIRDADGRHNRMDAALVNFSVR